MQITLFWNDEHTIGLDEQFFCDQFNRHFRVAGENLVEQGGYGPQVINDDNSHTHISRRGYYAWVEQWWRHPGFDWAIIPDVIDGDEAANDALVAEWPFGKAAGVPVWHLHEGLERLTRLATDWPRVALGSSGHFRTPGTPVWWGRMQQAMEAVCDKMGRPQVKLHGLRMLSPHIVDYVPFASADSAYVSRKVGLANWGGCYKQASREARAHVLVDYCEASQSAPVWAGIPAQEELFG